MREMKNSGIEWIGEIPVGWKVKKAKRIFKERNEKGNEISLQLLSPSQKYGVIPQSELDSVVKVKENTDLSTFKTIHAGDYCISLRSFQGGFEYSVYEGVVSPAYHVFYANIDINHLYYKFLFKCVGFIEKIASLPLTLRDGKNISFAMFGDIVIPIPPLKEQHRISTYLDTKCEKIDSIIARQQEVIEKLKAYKLSVITEVVTKGLNPDVSMKDSGVEWIGDVPEHWEVIKLKYATKTMRGRFNHRPRNDPAYYDGSYPFVQTGDVARAEKYISSYSQTLNDLGYSVSKEFPKGSICMTIAANVGDVAVLEFDACFPDSVVGFVPTAIVEWNYLYYVLKAMKMQFMRNAIISTQMNLNIEIIKEEPMPLPNLSEQLEIMDYLDKKCSAIDSAIAKKQAIIEKLTAYKKSLIYEVVTGKREV